MATLVSRCLFYGFDFFRVAKEMSFEACEGKEKKATSRRSIHHSMEADPRKQTIRFVVIFGRRAFPLKFIAHGDSYL
jgi:hypothetical protein